MTEKATHTEKETNELLDELADVLFTRWLEEKDSTEDGILEDK